MALVSVAASFWGKTVVVSTPLFWWRSGVGRFATAKLLKQIRVRVHLSTLRCR